MRWRNWLEMVIQGCLLKDSGSLCREQWVRRGHQNSAKINGGVLVHLQCRCFHVDTVGPTTRSKGSCETKVKRGAGVKMTATFWFASLLSCSPDFASADYRAHRIHSLDAQDESDIDWKSLNDPMWNIWGGHFLQQKWRHLKASCESDGTSCHRGGYMTSLLSKVLALRFLIDVVFQLLTKVSAARHMSMSAPSNP